MPKLEVKGITKVYKKGSVKALDNFSVTLTPGVYGLLGPNGAGKSTLMNLLGCLDTPSSGSYLCDGIDVATLDAEELATLRRDKIGFVFQGFHLLSRMSALDT